MPDIQNGEVFTPIEIEGGVVEEESFQDKRFGQMGNMVSLDASPYDQWSSLSEGNPLRELMTGSSEMRERDEFVTRIKDVSEDDITALFDSIGEQYNGGGANELYDKAYGQQDVDELLESIPGQRQMNNEFVREMGMKTTEDEFVEMLPDIPSQKDLNDEFAKEMGLANEFSMPEPVRVPSDFTNGMESLGLKELDKTTASFLDVIAQQENVKGNVKTNGWTGSKWIPYKSLEGGTDTVGYGHKLTKKEQASGKYSDGMTDEEALKLLSDDWKKFTISAKKFIGDKAWSTMSEKSRLLATEIEFNISGGLKGYPSFVKLIKNPSTANRALDEIGRGYTDAKTKKFIPLTNRVNAIKDWYNTQK